MKYVVVYERAADGGWGAYPPEIPGIGIVARTQDEARASIRKAIEMHLECMRQDGERVLDLNPVAVELIEVA